MQTGTDDLKLFREMRLAPWKSHQKILIDGWIAKFQVENPGYALQMKELYDRKLSDYIALQPKVEVAPAVVVQPVVIEEKKPRVGRPKKISPTI